MADGPASAVPARGARSTVVDGDSFYCRERRKVLKYGWARGGRKAEPAPARGPRPCQLTVSVFSMPCIACSLPSFASGMKQISA